MEELTVPFFFHSEEEEPDDHFYPLTLRTRKNNDRPQSPLDSISINGSNAPGGSPKQT
jgi:glycogen(starch) synthase